jgi:myo-inositol-1(or 4)-monophosphatase
MSSQSQMISESALAKLCGEVQVISMQVGKFIRDERKQFSASAVEAKAFNNLVSYVDKEAEKRFVTRLQEIFPEAGFIAEEDSTLRKGDRYNWVIDPLDGTTNFVHGVPCFATSVALLDGNEAILGVVYEINLDECFYAWKKGGAWLNGERIFVSKTAGIKSALIGTGFPYMDLGLHEKYLRLFSDVQQSSRGIRRPGSAATDIAWVAAGRFDVFYEYGLHAWDMAAGIVLVKEAGGMVTDFSGGDSYFEKAQIVTGTKAVHEEILQKIKTHFFSE